MPSLMSLQKSLLDSLITSSLGSFLAVLIGFLFARIFALKEWPLKRIQKLLLLIPYLVPNFVLAIAFVLTWNPTSGLLNFWITFPFGLYGRIGIIVLFAIVHMPVPFLMLESKIQRLDPALREAASLSGASFIQILKKIELPLIFPTLLSSFCLCFVLNISAFAIPAWLGAPEKVYPLTTKIYQVIQMGGSDAISQACFLSALLLALALPPYLIQFLFQKNENRYITLASKGSRPEHSKLSLTHAAVFQFFFWISQFFFWIAPLSCLFLSTLVKPGCLQRLGFSCFNDISLSSYHYILFELAETKSALRGSLIYGSLSAVLILFVSILTLFIFSKNKKYLKIADGLFTLPIATPGCVLAIGLIVLFSGNYGPNLYNTPWIVVVAYVLKHLNLAFQPLRTGLMNLSPSLAEAGRVSGSSQIQVWFKIILPILKPEVLGSFFLVLIPILGELSMSIFLASTSFQSIGTVLFDLQDYADQSSAAALAVLLVILVLLLNQLARWLSKGKMGY